jgi:hypothetical protein
MIFSGLSHSVQFCLVPFEFVCLVSHDSAHNLFGGLMLTICWFGFVWFCTVQFHLVLFDSVWFSSSLFGYIPFDFIWFSLVPFDFVWFRLA